MFTEKLLKDSEQQTIRTYNEIIKNPPILETDSLKKILEAELSNRFKESDARIQRINEEINNEPNNELSSEAIEAANSAFGN